jgi:hypothetical protein
MHHTTVPARNVHHRIVRAQNACSLLWDRGMSSTLCQSVCMPECMCALSISSTHPCSHCCTCRCGVEQTVMLSAILHVIIRFTLRHYHGWPNTIRLMSGLVARDCKMCLSFPSMHMHDLLWNCMHTSPHSHHITHITHSLTIIEQQTHSVVQSVHLAMHTAQFMACTGRQHSSSHAVAVSACRLHKHTSSRTAHREPLCECLSQAHALATAATTTATTTATAATATTTTATF